MADNQAPPIHRSRLRRKACSGCVRSKRRCDLVLPRCSRCEIKNLRCGYADEDSTATVVSSVTQQLDYYPSDPAASLFPVASPLPAESQLPAQMIPPQTSPTFLLENISPPTFPYFTLSYPPMESISQDRIDFCITQLKSCLPSFVLANRTLFIHPLSSDGNIPPLYQDALSICSLYMHRTNANKKVVFQMLDNKIDLLLLNSSHFSYRAENNLIELQVLLLYQIIRIFDGDTRQRANAERQFDLLDAWTVRLHKSYSEAEQSRPLYSSSRHWIYLESIRRTIMMSIFLRDLYSAMKNKVLALVPLRCTVPVSYSSGLWNESLVVETDYVGRLPHLVSYPEFVDAWNSGDLACLDDYDKTLVAACHLSLGPNQFRR